LEAAKEEKVRVEALMMMEAKRSIEEALDREKGATEVRMKEACERVAEQVRQEESIAWQRRMAAAPSQRSLTVTVTVTLIGGWLPPSLRRLRVGVIVLMSG